MIDLKLQRSTSITNDLDRELAILRLEQRITQMTSGRIRDLRVEAIGEGVMLHGRTSTYHAKQVATQIVKEWEVFGCLENQIEVE